MFVLNTTSGYLHDEDHVDSGEKFDRADAADLRAKELGMRMSFCKQCFQGNRNALDIEAPKSETQRVRPEAPLSSVHALDDAVPAGSPDPLTPPPLPRVSQTGR